ncbi:hypothetical protein RFI_03307 [Reticulomyxa filosa]|uniref:Uncharacterized protein n=1 Tax=Reticulomyxa filosa TaxID=46433 RepID=X6P6I8_RETFI|nr:hypothetical protein RFI_03307 [Reticulomyxa filosa]|eukprot:ETO33796.1 hypothetical protein RFI_03307 [Reticulomyxa filosa]
MKGGKKSKSKAKDQSAINNTEKTIKKPKNFDALQKCVQKVIRFWQRECNIKIVGWITDFDKMITRFTDSNGELKTMKGHVRPVRSVHFSPDGCTVVSGAYDETIRLWNVQSGKQILKLDTIYDVEYVQFSPDGKTIASCSLDSTLRLWDVKLGIEIKNIIIGEAIRKIRFSLDGNTILAYGYGNDIEIWNLVLGKKLWDAKTYKQEKIFQGHSNYVISAYSILDGQTIVSASLDKTVRLWDSKSAQQLQKIELFNEIRGLNVSPDGKTLLLFGLDRIIRLWDANSLKEIHSWKAHSSTITDTNFSSDNSTIVTSSCDNTIRLWRLR